MIATPSSNTTIVHTLGPYDILCGRSKAAYNNIGNRRFRVTISMNLQKYVDASSKGAKGAAVMHVVRFLTEEVGARFVKEQGDHYVTIDKKGIREKVAHAMRDMSAKHQNQQERKQNKSGTSTNKSSSMKKIRSLKRNYQQSTSSSLLSKSLETNDEDEACFSKSVLLEQQDMKFESLISDVLSTVDLSPLDEEMMASIDEYDFTSFSCDKDDNDDDDDCISLMKEAMPTSCCFNDVDNTGSMINENEDFDIETFF